MDKKEGMNRWKMARTFRPLLLWGGLAAALLWGCFNPIMSAPDPGSENQGSADQGSENSGSENQGVGLNPGDGAAGEFTVVLRIGEDSRSVVGPDAEDIRYAGVWNTVQVIAVDAETQEVKDNQLVNLDNENDSGKTIWPIIDQGKRYHFLVLMGHRELDYTNENPDIKYEYKSDPPTLLAAGFLGDQAIHGQATLSVTMKPLVVDTVFKHGDFTKPAVFPDEKGEVIQLPAKVAASVVWTVTGGFATLVDAQTRTGLPGGLNWGGLTLTGKTFIRNGAALDALDDPKPVLSGAERNQIVLDLGAQNAAGTSGSANFRLTYNPLGEAETWIIRNGVNDLAQNSKTTFDRDSNGKIPWKGTTADKENGNGAVVFEFADQKIPSIDLAGLVPAPVTGEVPAIPLGAGTYKTMEVVWNATAGSKTRFEGETVYAATVTLEPETGFFFRDGVTVTHGGSSSLLYISRAAQKVVVDVLFPKTGVFWEYGGYFSGSSSTGMDSAIDAIGAAKTAGFSSLSLKLLPWPETVDISALSGSDISGGLELTTATNSPASVTIDGGGKTIPLKAGNTVSVITVGNGVTLTLKNITFKGSNANNAALIRVTAGGKLVLQDGAVITGNTNSSSGGGVEVTGNGKLDMTGGEISGNTVTSASQRGGGVYVNGSGEFTMSGGTISGNKTTNSSSYGGGVSVDGGASFVMTGGVISGNTAGNNAGGVYVYYGSTFTMHNGKISGNKAYTGGGVYVNDSTFTMNNGVISGNTATTNGGGVQVTSALTDITFTMNGGKISGNKADNGTGGGVRVSNNNSTFTMNNGEISGNTATTNGGGVYFAAKTFTMHRGIIYGNEDINGDKKNIASTGAAFYKGSGTAQWDESKDGSLKELNTINTTLDLR